ncbi:hypothetical protein FE257_008042 [Aspergillus nanangensis]|uniref:Uncharacterized protein n=1 Tax=Aspergillus nanangensis TaxID=2582783 RepID=A0AAD4CM59_ASPNN|nr:hypothetical protein FE257_008042 [Aspergillus nanangensis]
MSHNQSLYGHRPKPKSKTSSSDAPSSSTLAFTTALTSLISKDTSTGNNTSARPRPSKAPKPSIFTQHNKGAQKRAAADLLPDDHNNAQQTHQRSADIGAADPATLHRSKRRMEEKAAMYDDLKRGMYLAAGSDDDDDDDVVDAKDSYLGRLRRKEKEGLVDFDRKWADAQKGESSSSFSSSSGGSEDEDEDGDNASVVSYEDELGRSRQGTRTEAARAQKLKQQQQEAEGGGLEEQVRWKPNRPQNLIYGATVQSQAFNPEAVVAEQMASLAKRRDRSATPPGETHYDAEAEVRNRGTGFYAFSRDEEERRRQMQELLGAREETQREREGRRERRVQREKVKGERRGKIEELRSKRRAEMFLAGLEVS